ncbi:unnamed protein product [Agarophyton chilense]
MLGDAAPKIDPNGPKLNGNAPPKLSPNANDPAPPGPAKPPAACCPDAPAAPLLPLAAEAAALLPVAPAPVPSCNPTNTVPGVDSSSSFPSLSSPPSPLSPFAGETEGDADGVGLEGDFDCVGEVLGETDTEGVTDGEGVIEGETDIEAVGDGEAETEGVTDGEAELDAEGDGVGVGVRDLLGLGDGRELATAAAPPALFCRLRGSAVTDADRARRDSSTKKQGKIVSFMFMISVEYMVLSTTGVMDDRKNPSLGAEMVFIGVSAVRLHWTHVY